MQAASIADDLLRRRQPEDARRVLAPYIAALPKEPALRQLMGRILRALGELDAAEQEFREGLSADRKHLGLHLDLAALLSSRGRRKEAERLLRAVLARSPRAAPAATALSDVLLADGRPQEALQVTAASAGVETPDLGVLTARGEALKALGRTSEALAVYQRAATLYPHSAVAEHNVAAAQGDLADFAAAEASARRAFTKGGDAPETWLVHARALLGLKRLDQAEASYREAIGRQPALVDAQRELAQLMWMRSEDVDTSIAHLAPAIAAVGADSVAGGELMAVRAKALELAGEAERAYADMSAAVRRWPNALALRLSAAHLAGALGYTAEGVDHAEAAIRLAPEHTGVLAILCEACLAAGEGARAAEVAGALRLKRPDDQTVIAYLAMAWRLLGDPRYAELYDYDGLVRAWRLDTPKGWPTLDGYLADLAQALGPVHPFRTHPLDQSLRHGSQASHITASTDPVIQAFFQTVEGPIRRHLAWLAERKPGPLDTVRRRNRGDFAFQGVWSVRLRPGGFHANHVHPDGWLSSACYIALPPGVTEAPDKAGWIKFGEPGIVSVKPLPPEHFVAPEPGRLVLFPSYMWHGTVPFEGQAPRLTIAFDLQPKR
jgi:uncharacterized protein (TIGR02466 family)